MKYTRERFLQNFRTVCTYERDHAVTTARGIEVEDDEVRVVRQGRIYTLWLKSAVDQALKHAAMVDGAPFASLPFDEQTEVIDPHAPEPEKLELESLKDSDELFVVRLLCSDCKGELNSTKPMTGKELWREWTMMVLTSGFNAGKCPHGCRSTFSDLNINTDMVIVRADESTTAATPAEVEQQA